MIAATGIAVGLGAATFAVFGGLFALSFFFSGTETAFFSLQEIDRRRIAEGDTATHRRIWYLLQRRTALITTILMGNETANVAISATTAALLATLVPDKPWLTVVLVAPALVLLSEITPKILAFRFNRLWVDLAVWPLTVLFWLLWPLRVVVVGMVSALARIFGVDDVRRHRPLREEEFLVLVERGAEAGIVGEEERDLIEAVFELDDLAVSRLMTPKPDIFSLPVDVAWDDLLVACREARYSRVPIYEGARDNVIGVLLLKDLLRHRRRPLSGADELRRLLMAPVFVPASKPANEMMKEMIRRRLHIAFVVDEHGTLMGLVSLDDLIMELVGEIGDEHSDETAEDIQDVDGVLTVRATLDLEDLEDATGIVVPEGDYHTLNGWVFHTLGRVPATGDVVADDGRIFEVVATEGRRASWIRIVAAPSGDEETVP